jgi:phospho-acceptor domain-containing protein
MNGSSAGAVGHRENAFLERIRRALAHDLRTPLGTITNYAAILEYQEEAKPADVRVFAGRIRQSAVRAAAMLQHLTDAIVLSEREPSLAGFEPVGLVRALISELPVPARFPANGQEPSGRLPLDSDLLAFTWRAFLVINAEAPGVTGLDVDVEVAHDDGVMLVDMWLGARPTAPPTHSGTSKYIEGGAETTLPESCFALGLAEDLVHMRGGEMSLWGRPGQASNLRLSFPRSH